MMSRRCLQSAGSAKNKKSCTAKPAKQTATSTAQAQTATPRFLHHNTTYNSSPSYSHFDSIDQHNNINNTHSSIFISRLPIQ